MTASSTGSYAAAAAWKERSDPLSEVGLHQGHGPGDALGVDRSLEGRPLLGKCGGKLEIIAYLHDQVSISRILDHLGLGPPETAKPPPALHEVVRVPLDEEGREIEAP
jgi:hypothetical protein